MVVLVMLAMFLVFIGISYWREQTAKRRMSAAAPVSSTVQPQAERLYLHPSHSFARVISADEVEVGMDEFSNHAFAYIEEIVLPEKGAKVQQGDIAWRARVGGRMIAQRIPVDGVVTQVNDKGGSWLLKIKPSHLGENINNLIQSTSITQWLKMARSRFLMEHAGALVPAMQDGGELVEGFARHLTDAQWQAFCKEFFNDDGN
jgi:glycine cleavage system H lipoate-binding protein